MRILHVVPSYVPAWRYGGPIRSVHGLCKALRNAGHDVEVFTTNVDGAGDLPVPTGTPVDVEGVKVWYFPSQRLRRLYWSPEMGRALKRNAGQFDVIHLHSIYLWPTLAGARAARRANVPYVLSPRGMLMRELIRGKSWWLKAAWIRLIERSNLAHAAAVHFTSGREAAEAKALGLAFRRVLVVPNGADIEAQGAAPGNGRDPPDVPRPYLLFIGRVSWEKGLDRMVAALPFVPEAVLVIAGASEGNPLREKLEALARQLAVHARIRFLGEVHGASKAYLLANAAALVVPSYSESFGNVVLEAMAAGCPVVATPEVGAAEVVAASGSGAVLAGDPATLGGGIARLLANRALLAEMGRRGRRAFEEQFTWSAIAKRMLDGYREILAAKGSP